MENRLRIGDRCFRTMMTAAEIDATVGHLADRINADYRGQELAICPVLTGAYVFAADLMRKLTMPCEVSFVRYTSYAGMQSTGVVKCDMPFDASLQGRDVLVVEDVVDSGLSMQHMLHELADVGPRSVRLCTLLYKPRAFRGDYTVDYVGREIGNEFIVGYGMDYNEIGRNLPQIYVLDEEATPTE